MNRLLSELHRRYLPRSASDPGPDADAASLIAPDGTVRAVVLELARPAEWDVLSRVWRGVQTDLELPAPGIAVSGTDGFQLWFSLAEPVTVAQAQAFAESLRMRYLPEVKTQRIGVWPSDVSGRAVHAPRVPEVQEVDGNWSAFVAPDLAPVFDATPWLDIPPGVDGQAELLHRLRSIERAAFADAVARLAPTTPAASSGREQPRAPMSAPASAPPSGPLLDPRQFLLNVMNDESVALPLRIDAAKALLNAPPAR